MENPARVVVSPSVTWRIDRGAHCRAARPPMRGRPTLLSLDDSAPDAPRHPRSGGAHKPRTPGTQIGGSGQFSGGGSDGGGDDGGGLEGSDGGGGCSAPGPAGPGGAGAGGKGNFGSAGALERLRPRKRAS